MIDAHHHLWDRVQPWMTGPLRRPYGLDDLRAVAQPAGVIGTVAIEAATQERETVELLRLAEASGGLIRAVVGWVDLTAPNVADRIEALRRGPGGHRLAGFRHHVQDEPDPDWLLRPDVLCGLAEVADAGLRYDLLVRPPQIPAARRMAELVEELPLVVDHGAKPAIATGGWEPWSGDLRRLAAIERVHCKLSGLVTEARWDRWREDGIERYIDRMLELFGPGRLMFGSDWPVCTLAASYREVLDLVRDHLGAAERETILSGTASRFYGLE